MFGIGQGFRCQAWVGNVPEGWSMAQVSVWLSGRGFAPIKNVYLNKVNHFGIPCQYAIITFHTEEIAARFRAAGAAQNSLFWPSGQALLVKPVEQRGYKRRGTEDQDLDKLKEMVCHIQANLYKHGCWIGQMLHNWSGAAGSAGHAGVP